MFRPSVKSGNFLSVSLPGVFPEFPSRPAARSPEPGSASQARGRGVERSRTRPLRTAGALCAPGRGLPRGSLKGPAGHVARDGRSLRPPGRQFRRWAAPARYRRAACAWPNLSAENLSPRVVRPVGGGSHPNEDTVAMAEAAPARVSAPARWPPRARVLAHQARSAPSLPCPSPSPRASWRHRPGGHRGHGPAPSGGRPKHQARWGCALRPVTATRPPEPG